jgi:anion-transporting  ArsA/GET3 family ATPase
MKNSNSSNPRLHIFLGAGGVGKTTLSAGFALSLARSGRRVGLLSIDPARRLQTALSVGELTEAGVQVPLDEGTGELRAALLLIGDSLRRWVREEGLSPDAEARLFANPLFKAVAEKLATATDTFAMVRIAEWVEKDSTLDDLVIDTAPGIHAIDFLAKPEKLMAFFDSKIIDWMRWFMGDAETKATLWQKVVKSGARKILDGLAQIGGQNLLLNLGEFLMLLDTVFLRMMGRLEFSRGWLRDPSTNIVLVTSVRDDAVAVARELGYALHHLKLKPNQAVINRSFPEHLKSEVALREFISKSGIKNAMDEDSQTFANYLKSFLAIQGRVEKDLGQFAKDVIELPVVAHLDSSANLRLSDLAGLGELLRSRKQGQRL